MVLHASLDTNEIPELWPKILSSGDFFRIYDAQNETARRTRAEKCERAGR